MTKSKSQGYKDLKNKKNNSDQMNSNLQKMKNLKEKSVSLWQQVKYQKQLQYKMKSKNKNMDNSQEDSWIEVIDMVSLDRIL